jgi:DNA-binding NarL/FixJ family response regulator
VAIVEDNDVFREALEMLLGLESGLEVVATAPHGDDAPALCREHSPDVVLMDYRLPGLDGVQATRLLLEACPDVAVVGLTASANLREVDALLAAGAVACLTKDEPLEDIVAAIHRAAEQ